MPDAKVPGLPRTLAACPDGVHAAIGDSDGTVRVMRADSGKLVWKLRPGVDRPRERAIDFLAWSPLGDRLAWTSNRMLYVARASSGVLHTGRPCFEVAPLQSDGARHLVADPGGEWVAFRALWSGPLVVIDVASRRVERTIDLGGEYHPISGGYEADIGFMGPGMLGVCQSTAGLRRIDLRGGPDVVHAWPPLTQAFYLGWGFDGRSPFVVHPVPDDRSEGFRRSPALAVWTPGEPPRAIEGSVSAREHYALVPGHQCVLYLMRAEGTDRSKYLLKSTAF